MLSFILSLKRHTCYTKKNSCCYHTSMWTNLKSTIKNNHDSLRNQTGNNVDRNFKEPIPGLLDVNSDVESSWYAPDDGKYLNSRVYRPKEFDPQYAAWLLFIDKNTDGPMEQMKEMGEDLYGRSYEEDLEEEYYSQEEESGKAGRIGSFIEFVFKAINITKWVFLKVKYWARKYQIQQESKTLSTSF